MSKIKLQIKALSSEIIFEYESENNTIKKTVEAFLKSKKDTVITGVDLSNMDLSGITFDNSTFYNSKFDNSKFDNSKFYNSTFDNSKFYNSTFDNSTFDNSKFYNSTFDNSTFYNSTFDNSKFYNSTFDNSKFYNSTFDNSTFDNSKFYNSTFDNSTFYNSTFDKDSINSLSDSGALDPVRFDFFGRMLVLKKEVPYLKDSLINGKVKGTSYTGVCSCFMGTAAAAKNCKYTEIPGIKPDANSDTERWFMGIKEGDTPENSEIVKLTVQWIEEFEMFLNA